MNEEIITLTIKGDKQFRHIIHGDHTVIVELRRNHTGASPT
jgi:hypothetical protein